MPIIERWCLTDREETDGPLSDDRRAQTGGPSGRTHRQWAVGHRVVEADGDIEGLDVLRVCGDGTAVAGRRCCVTTSTDRGRQRAAWPRHLRGAPAALGLRRLPRVRHCGGGYLPHRFSRERGLTTHRSGARTFFHSSENEGVAGRLGRGNRIRRVFLSQLRGLRFSFDVFRPPRFTTTPLRVRSAPSAELLKIRTDPPFVSRSVLASPQSSTASSVSSRGSVRKDMTNESIGIVRPAGDFAARQHALASLGDLLKSSLTVEKLKGWVSESVPIRSPFLQDRVFGKIRWKKSIGRSLGPTLSSGFRAENWFHYLNWAVGADGVPVDIGKAGAGPGAHLLGHAG